MKKNGVILIFFIHNYTCYISTILKYIHLQRPDQGERLYHEGVVEKYYRLKYKIMFGGGGGHYVKCR